MTSTSATSTMDPAGEIREVPATEPGESARSALAPSDEELPPEAGEELPPEAGEDLPATETDDTAAARGSRIDAFRELVGVLSDAKVAEQAGVSRSAVTQYRERHGIAAAQPKGIHKGRKGKAGGKRSAPKRAERSRRPPERVVQPAPVPAAAPAPISATARAQKERPGPSAAMYGWRIRLWIGVDEVERVVIAGDASSAARMASRYGEVLFVERLDRALG